MESFPVQLKVKNLISFGGLTPLLQHLDVEEHQANVNRLEYSIYSDLRNTVGSFLEFNKDVPVS